MMNILFSWLPFVKIEETGFYENFSQKIKSCLSIQEELYLRVFNFHYQSKNFEYFLRNLKENLFL